MTAITNTSTMSNTKRQPLLSDDMLKDAEEVVEVSSVPVDKLYKFREIYEAARAKDAELIQQLVNALQNAHDRHNGVGGTMYISEEHKALSAAKAAGFKPSDR